MRKIFLFMSLSLDGYFEGPNHDISWHRVDDDFNRFAIDQLRETDLFIFGRRIYQLMESAWPKIAEDPSATENDLEIALLINHTEKMVFSRTLDKVEEKENWRNVSLRHDFDPEEIRKLKDQPGKSISVGGSDMAIPFIRAGLIDEFRFTIAPVMLRAGTRIFEGLESDLDLKLIKAQPFASGNVVLCYRPSSTAKI
ncbi:MAG TPA: dihydrofolate reductase family protein [Methanomassiliicoccales archaeon]|jgi:dihydrofolate reductase